MLKGVAQSKREQQPNPIAPDITRDFALIPKIIRKFLAAATTGPLLNRIILGVSCRYLFIRMRGARTEGRSNANATTHARKRNGVVDRDHDTPHDCASRFVQDAIAND